MQGGWWVGGPKPNLLLTIIYFSNVSNYIFVIFCGKSFSQFSCKRTLAKKQAASEINLLHNGIYFLRAVGNTNRIYYSRVFNMVATFINVDNLVIWIGTPNNCLRLNRWLLPFFSFETKDAPFSKRCVWVDPNHVYG